MSRGRLKAAIAIGSVGLATVFAARVFSAVATEPPHPEWPVIRALRDQEWKVSYSFMTGIDERYPENPELQRHRRDVSLNHEGVLLVVSRGKGKADFQREERLSKGKRDALFANVVKIFERYDFDNGDLPDRVGSPLKLQSGRTTLILDLARPEDKSSDIVTLFEEKAFPEKK